ncbi:MAG TPA: enoyl-CoA hydratase/isomerase family protein [Caulobacteraceae bacterium]|nr:enoyl-CoA hydratase/isomerase family protein [Caulobacteraceae bacterium]
MSEEPEVTVRVVGEAGRLTLNRPRALNALNAGMCETIIEALVAWRDDATIGHVLIDGAGERAFCAGGDIRVVAESGKTDGAEARRFFHTEYRMNELLFRYPKPVVVNMGGITMGGGVGISAPGRLRLATERTLWAMPEGDIGLFPDVGGGWHLARLPGQTGVWAALTGARLNGFDCADLDIATHIVTTSDARNFLWQISGAPAGEEPASQDPVEAERASPPSALAGHRQDIDRLFAFDTVEEIVAALGADGSDWARAQADILARKCPTTLKVALRLIREGAARTSFAEEMEVEYRLAVRMTRRHDFIDGVRAVIVDKDNAPRWEPATLAGVTDAMLDELFAPLAAGEEWTPLA